MIRYEIKNTQIERKSTILSDGINSSVRDQLTDEVNNKMQNYKRMTIR